MLRESPGDVFRRIAFKRRGIDPMEMPGQQVNPIREVGARNSQADRERLIQAITTLVDNLNDDEVDLVLQAVSKRAKGNDIPSPDGGEAVVESLTESAPPGWSSVKSDNGDSHYEAGGMRLRIYENGDWELWFHAEDYGVRMADIVGFKNNPIPSPKNFSES